jgi:hypothetical protein
MSFAGLLFGVDDPAQVVSLLDVTLPTSTPALSGTDSWSHVASGVTGGGVMSGMGKGVIEVNGEPGELWCCGMVCRSGVRSLNGFASGTCKVQPHTGLRTVDGYSTRAE